ncbi:MAG: EutN/CcmL family microcompartment protein [Bacteroidota bacterium]
MLLGKVIGNVVSVKKESNLEGLKLLVIKYLNEELQFTGKSVVCTDTVSAGPGDMVLLCSSSSARMTRLTKDVCTDNTIVGIVDSISSSGQVLYHKKNGIGK